MEKKIRKKDINKIIYILSLALAFGGNHFFQVAIGSTWILYALFKIAREKNACKMDYITHLKWYLLPCILIHMYTVMLIFFKQTKAEILTTNLITYIPIILGISSIYLFGWNACKYNYMALILYWIVQTVSNIFLYGFGIIRNAILQGWFNISVGRNLFELHDIVLASGYFLIIFLFEGKRERKEAKLIVIFILMIFLLGIKRIGILALLFGCILYIVMKRMPLKRQYRFCLFLGFFGVVAGVLFIYILSQGSLFYDLIERLGVNVMARDYFFKRIMLDTKFSPSFIGYGRGSVKIRMLQYFKDFSNVHCDYIKMYTEIGFVLYIAWLWYYLVEIIKKVKRRYGYYVAVVAFFVTVYTFILYFTDNTESYYICSLMRTTIPLAYAMKSRYIKDKEQI